MKNKEKGNYPSSFKCGDFYLCVLFIYGRERLREQTYALSNHDHMNE